MRKHKNRILMATSIALSGAYLCASGTLSCGSLAGEAGMATADMCFIFDCTDGMFGGLIDPCASVQGTDKPVDESGDDTLINPFFVDCFALEIDETR